MSATRSASEKESLKDFRIDALEAINPTRKDLDGLKDEIRVGLHDNMYQVLQYCETNRVDYFTSWETVLDSGDSVAIGHFEKAMAMIMPSNSVDFISKLKAGDDDGKKMLDVIVHFLKERKVKSAKTEEDIDVLSTDVSGTFLGKVVENLGDRLEENPLATVLSGAVLLWGTSALWNRADAEGKGGKPYFKNLLIGGVSLLSINHMLGPVIKGQTLFGSIESMFSKGKQQELRESLNDRMPKASEKDKETIEVLMGYSNVPFKYLLSAYERAKKAQGNSREIDMGRLQNSMGRHGKNISEAAFKQSLGRGLFNKLESLIGSDDDDIRVAKERYVNGDGGPWITIRVLLDTYDKDPDFAYEVDEVTRGVVSGAVDGGVAAALGGTPVTISIKPDYQNEFKDVKDIDKLDLHIGENGKAEVRGVAFDYVRDDSAKASGVIKYTFKGMGTVGSTDIVIEVGEKPGLAPNFAPLETEAKNRVTAMAAAKGLSAPTWDPAAKAWSVASYMPTNSLGYAPAATPVTLELVDGKFARLKVAGFSESFKDTTALNKALEEKFVVDALRKDRDFEQAFGEGLTIRVKDLSKKTLSVEDAEVIFDYNATTGFSVTKFTVGEKFVDKKVEQARSTGDFEKVFKDLRASGEELSQWRRAADLIGSRWRGADNVNYHWKEIVDFKEDQILQNYHDALMGVGTATNLDVLTNAFNDTVGDTIRDLETLQTSLSNADNEAVYDNLEEEFLLYDLGSSDYKDRFTQFRGTVETLQLPGVAEKSNLVHQAVEFKIMRVWFDHTNEFRNAPFNPTQTAYLDKLEAEITDALNQAQRSDANVLQRYIRSGINEVEFYKLYPGLKTLPKYKEWQKLSERDEALEAAIPALQVVGALGYHVEADPAVIGGKIIKFNDGTEWKVSGPSNAPQLTSMTLTKAMVDLQVEHMAQQSEFTEAFEALEHIFASMNRHPWESLLQGEFEEAFDGVVAENRWKSLIDYKRKEAKDDYRARLLTTYGGAPASWGAVTMNVGHYVGLAQVIEKEIASKIGAGETFTRERFEEFYDMAQAMGYESSEYVFAMMNMRDEIRIFDFEGFDSLDSRRAEDVMNLAMELQNKYTRELDTGTAWGQDELNYFQYVHMKVLTALRRAHDNNTLWDMLKQDDVIHREEIPKKLKLDVVSFDKFKADPHLFKDVAFTYDLGEFKKQLEKEDQKDTLLETLETATTALEAVYQAEWIQKVNDPEYKRHKVRFPLFEKEAALSRDRYIILTVKGADANGKPLDLKRAQKLLKKRLEKCVSEASKSWYEVEDIPWIPFF